MQSTHVRLPLGSQIFPFLLTLCTVLLASWVPATAVIPPAPAELEEVMIPFRKGNFEESVQRATDALAKIGKPDPHILYWRAYAERRLGWFDAAEKDYAGLGDFVAWPKYPAASQEAAELKRMLELRPPHIREIRVGERLAFEVYFTQEDAFTQSIMEALPNGYNAASTVLQKQNERIPIFIFRANDYERFTEFFTLLHGSAPHAWWRYLSSSGSITFSESDANGNLAKASVSVLSALLAHELTHINAQRMLGKVSDIPNWFNEGSAQLVQATLLPAMLRQNDIKIQQLLEQNAILPLEQIGSHAGFHEAADAERTGKATSDAYAQGLSMTRYLVHVLKGAPLSDFLSQVQEKQGFEVALKESTGMNSQEFYDSWLKTIRGNQ